MLPEVYLLLWCSGAQGGMSLLSLDFALTQSLQQNQGHALILQVCVK